MITKKIKYITGDYRKDLDKKSNIWSIRSENNTEERKRELRIAKFKELLLEINNDEDPDIQPYLRATLGYKYVEYIMDMKEYGYDCLSANDYKEIADYFIAVIDDIEYVSANDYDICNFPEAHNKFLNRTNPDVTTNIIHAIALHHSKEVMRKYIYSVVNSHYCKRDGFCSAIYFARVIHEYAMKEDYQSMIDYGKWMIENLKERDVYNKYLETIYSNLVNEVEFPHVELDKVFKQFGISDEAHEAVMDNVRIRCEKKTKEEAEKRLEESLFKDVKDISSKKVRTSKFKESLKIIEDTYPMILHQCRVRLCYSYAKALYEKFKDTHTIDYKELAGYLSTVMNDIEYVAANDTTYYADYQNIYRIDQQDFISCIVEAIDKHLPEAYMKRFMNSVVSIEYNKKKLQNLVGYFRCVIQEYTRTKKYQKVADYAKWFMQVYKEKEYNCTSLGVYDFQVTVDAIHTYIDEAYKSLKITDAEHEKIMVDIRKRAAETPRERQNREKAELYDQAQRCKAAGDEAGYCGYMSVLGDIGR